MPPQLFAFHNILLQITCNTEIYNASPPNIQILDRTVRLGPHIHWMNPPIRFPGYRPAVRV